LNRARGRGRSRDDLFRDAIAFGTRFREDVYLEFGDVDRPAVFINDEVLLREVRDGIPFPIRDEDLDELKGDGNLVVWGFLENPRSPGLGGDDCESSGKGNKEQKSNYKL
jgi:hypothetical protein